MRIFSIGRVVLGVSVVSLSFIANRVEADLLVYEGFDIDTVELDGQGSGLGWNGPWQRYAGGQQPEVAFDVPQDGVSLDSTAYPVSTLGSRLEITSPGPGFSGEIRANRTLRTPFDLEDDGNTMFVSFLFQKDVSTGAPANMEFNFGNEVGTLATRVRLGSTSGDAFFLNSSGNQLGAINLGETYFLTMKVEAVAGGANNVWASVYGATDVVPSEEPSTWGASSTFANPVSNFIEGVSLWMGLNAAGQFDEFRMGSTWESVTIDEVSLPMVPGDFDMDGNVDGDDFLMWQRGESPDLLSEGDLNDWIANFGTTDYGLFGGIGSDHENVAAVPEPGSLACVAIGCLCVGLLRLQRPSGNLRKSSVPKWLDLLGGRFGVGLRTTSRSSHLASQWR